MAKPRREKRQRGVGEHGDLKPPVMFLLMEDRERGFGEERGEIHESHCVALYTLWYVN